MLLKLANVFQNCNQTKAFKAGAIGFKHMFCATTVEKKKIIINLPFKIRFI